MSSRTTDSDKSKAATGTPPSFPIAGRSLGPDSPVFLIAEAGTAHLGDLQRAHELIDAAAESGADSVKFQWVIADEIVHPNAGAIRLPGGMVPIWDKFRRLERPPEFYADLKEYAEKRGLLFLCSPFGLESARQLMKLDVEAVKIASPELNHYPLLHATASKPLILSTGISTLEDIERTVRYLEQWQNSKFALLHCITAYPAPEDEYNLRVLPPLASLFGVITGISDHSTDPLIVPALALSQGAKIIEKHFTLSRKSGGLDDPIALEPRDFEQMSGQLRRMESLQPKQIIEEADKMFGKTRVMKVLGNGRKRLAPSEAPYYSGSNRSIVARHDLAAGDILGTDNMALLRSEQNQTAGLAPHFWDTLLGSRLRRDVPGGRGITFQDLI